MLAAESSVDAQSLISMSLRKIHNSRSERGGIKLHKNLLVSYVLRNARQLYLSERRVNNNNNNNNGGGGVGGGGVVVVGGGVSIHGSGCAVAQPRAEPLCVCPANRDSHCTVLDLDTHTVTTVETGFSLRDCAATSCCCCGSSLGSSPQKRKCGSSGDPEDFSLLPGVKRVRLGEFPPPDPHCHLHLQHSGHISSLVSIFHAGFSGLVHRADPDPDPDRTDTDSDGDDDEPPLLQQQLPESASTQSGQPCGKQALAGLAAWTRAIVAF
ncbi:immediate early response gene 5-like protein [Callorhinchus milii]|uniref:immediate early response gene 5-like protein n=1 Tax=Callorhinchus milii TaxID=7868 RepID=UPI001C3F72AA|nr:immediate early response gene 5-like protein [Callorhinchus milii]